jgi:DNA polymerase-4
MSHGPANILHVDMDAFFASVEQLRRPELKGKPVIVGGDGQRGVVAAASYEARVYGIRSAMASTQARRLCPDAVFVPGDHAHYGQISQRVMEVFSSFTPLVEPLSLDEAFLDVAGSIRLHGQPVEIARAIRRMVYEQEQLTCSVGVAPNKFLAKLATEDAKPTPSRAGPVLGPGVRVIEAGDVQDFLDALPIRAIWGVGPATAARLDRLGVATVFDLRQLPAQTLVAALGNVQGRHLHDLARGSDERTVTPNRGVKSISHEETFTVDLFDSRRLLDEAVRLADAVGNRLRTAGHRARTVNIKVRFGDFETITRSATLPSPTDSGTVIAREAKRLLGLVDPTPGVRLLGVGVSSIAKETAGEQLSLDDLATNNLEWREAEGAIDVIRDKFGDGAIGPASSLGISGLRPKRRGDQQWGPSDQGS